MRQAIIDVLEGTRDCPVTELARILNRPADALYYHLRLLEKAGLLVERRGVGRADRACKAYALRRRGTVLEYKPSSKTNTAVITRIVASMLRDASRSFRRAFVGGETVHGRQRTLWAGRRVGWLSKKDVADINRAVGKIGVIMRSGAERSPQRRLFAFTHVLSPYERKPRPDKRLK